MAISLIEIAVMFRVLPAAISVVILLVMAELVANPRRWPGDGRIGGPL